MAGDSRIRRLTLVPFEGPNDELRRYRLARMDEIALATPPDPSAAGNAEARPDAGTEPAKPAGEPAPPV